MGTKAKRLVAMRDEVVRILLHSVDRRFRGDYRMEITDRATVALGIKSSLPVVWQERLAACRTAADCLELLESLIDCDRATIGLVLRRACQFASTFREAYEVMISAQPYSQGFSGLAKQATCLALGLATTDGECQMVESAWGNDHQVLGRSQTVSKSLLALLLAKESKTLADWREIYHHRLASDQQQARALTAVVDDLTPKLLAADTLEKVQEVWRFWINKWGHPFQTVIERKQDRLLRKRLVATTTPLAIAKLLSLASGKNLRRLICQKCYQALEVRCQVARNFKEFERLAKLIEEIGWPVRRRLASLSHLVFNGMLDHASTDDHFRRVFGYATKQEGLRSPEANQVIRVLAKKLKTRTGYQ